jgi:hypothetical protein
LNHNCIISHMFSFQMDRFCSLRHFGICHAEFLLIRVLPIPPPISLILQTSRAHLRQILSLLLVTSMNPDKRCAISIINEILMENAAGRDLFVRVMMTVVQFPILI